MHVAEMERGPVAAPLAGMRPRRWYSVETPPPTGGVRLTPRLWQYRTLVRCPQQIDATPTIGVASAFGARRGGRPSYPTSGAPGNSGALSSSSTFS